MGQFLQDLPTVCDEPLRRFFISTNKAVWCRLVLSKACQTRIDRPDKGPFEDVLIRHKGSSGLSVFVLRGSKQTRVVCRL